MGEIYTPLYPYFSTQQDVPGCAHAFWQTMELPSDARGSRPSSGRGGRGVLAARGGVAVVLPPPATPGGGAPASALPA